MTIHAFPYWADAPERACDLAYDLAGIRPTQLTVN